MKSIRWTAGLFLLVGCRLFAEATAPATEPLADAVRQSLERVEQGRKTHLTGVRDGADGKVYQFQVENSMAANTEISIAADGRVVSDTANATVGAMTAPVVYPGYIPATAPAAQLLSLRDLPSAVQQTVKKESAGRRIATISSARIDGKPGYRVSFEEPGMNPDIVVADDGSLLSPLEKPPGMSSLFIGKTFQDLPAAVQSTVRREVAAGEITKIDKEGRGDAACYLIDITEHGTQRRIRVDLSGRLTDGSRDTPANH